MRCISMREAAETNEEVLNRVVIAEALIACWRRQEMG